eukprot:gene10301-1862_t
MSDKTFRYQLSSLLWPAHGHTRTASPFCLFVGHAQPQPASLVHAFVSGESRRKNSWSDETVYQVTGSSGEPQPVQFHCCVELGELPHMPEPDVVVYCYCPAREDTLKVLHEEWQNAIMEVRGWKSKPAILNACRVDMLGSKGRGRGTKPPEAGVIAQLVADLGCRAYCETSAEYFKHVYTLFGLIADALSSPSPLKGILSEDKLKSNFDQLRRECSDGTKGSSLGKTPKWGEPPRDKPKSDDIDAAQDKAFGRSGDEAPAESSAKKEKEEDAETRMRKERKLWEKKKKGTTVYYQHKETKEKERLPYCFMNASQRKKKDEKDAKKKVEEDAKKKVQEDAKQPPENSEEKNATKDSSKGSEPAADAAEDKSKDEGLDQNRDEQKTDQKDEKSEEGQQADSQQKDQDSPEKNLDTDGDTRPADPIMAKQSDFAEDQNEDKGAGTIQKQDSSSSLDAPPQPQRQRRLSVLERAKALDESAPRRPSFMAVGAAVVSAVTLARNNSAASASSPDTAVPSGPSTVLSVSSVPQPASATPAQQAAATIPEVQSGNQAASQPESGIATVPNAARRLSITASTLESSEPQQSTPPSQPVVGGHMLVDPATAVPGVNVQSPETVEREGSQALPIPSVLSGNGPPGVGMLVPNVESSITVPATAVSTALGSGITDGGSFPGSISSSITDTIRNQQIPAELSTWHATASTSQASPESPLSPALSNEARQQQSLVQFLWRKRMVASEFETWWNDQAAIVGAKEEGGLAALEMRLDLVDNQISRTRVRKQECIDRGERLEESLKKYLFDEKRILKKTAQEEVRAAHIQSAYIPAHQQYEHSRESLQQLMQDASTLHADSEQQTVGIGAKNDEIDKWRLRF